MNSKWQTQFLEVQKKRGLFFYLNCVDLLKFGLLPPQEVKRLMNHVKYQIVIKYLTLNNALI